MYGSVMDPCAGAAAGGYFYTGPGQVSWRRTCFFCWVNL